MLKKHTLLAPGPTQVPSEVLLSMAKPMIHHRTSAYREIFQRVTEGMQYIFKTKNDVLTFSSSGTGAMEASVVNTMSPGDKMLVVRAGKFGERFSEIGNAYGMKVVDMDVEWGTAPDPKEIEKVLKKNLDVKAVFVTQCETSTGVLTDVEAVGKLVEKTEAILVVDAISSLGACEMKVDEWGVDICIVGSQKALMLPPGIAFTSVSKKAWGLVEKAKCPNYYLSFKKAKKNLATFDNPWTPPVSLVIGLDEAIKMIRQEGIDNVIARHALLANALKEAMKALGLELYSKTPADTVTAVKVPEGVDGKKITKLLSSKYGVTIAGGQSQLEGKIFRVATLGYASTFDVIIAVSAIEMVLKELGAKIELGKGVKAAEEVLFKG
ncbi:alanine--glyoxylate aminotransferase family protein [bacterium]|nr:alanine--glyoxylate aminotransferase family protein [bacterium]